MRTSQLCLLPLAAGLLSATAPAAQIAYLCDSNLDQLFDLDLGTGNVTLIASTLNNGLGTPAGLAWRADVAELWTVDLSGGEVGPIDVVTGTFTPVFQTNISGWQDIAWDPGQSVFYLVNQDNNTYVLDPATGVTTLIGVTASGLVTALDFDPAGNLWALGFNGSILSIDLVSGVGTSGATTIANLQGLGIDSNGVWYAVNTTTNSLYSIDPVTGMETLIGPNPGIQFAKGMEVVTGGASGPTIACDPANNHSGGTYAKLDGSTPSGPGAYHLECTDGPAGEFGYFLVSATLNDPGASISNGMLCLGLPIGRYAPAAGGTFNSIGQFDAAGVMQNITGNSTVGSGYDVPSMLPTPPGGVITSGDTWYFQCWYRDGTRSNFSNVACVTF